MSYLPDMHELGSVLQQAAQVQVEASNMAADHALLQAAQAMLPGADSGKRSSLPGTATLLEPDSWQMFHCPVCSGMHGMGHG